MPDDPSPGSSQPSFEDAFARLERIVVELDDGQIGLSEALARYEEGIGLLRFCYRELDEAQRRIELLAGVDPEGRPRTEPFDEAASESAAPAGGERSRKRSARSKSAAPPDPGRPPEGGPGEAPGSLF